ncbi:aminodeoxychorismate/anthranilate synthase component II [Hymenobacter sp. BT175]|uniref:anthranilate synthase component II n=1 Tax=Hymenobacter translucens TaxID=2886507 RepID=UPI001D0DF259|nr:aminodeoxychorismate/anthranilate synthase component II [Hymenobacter translucens]MCC2546110.1 aminodeoxychorismate/anthranilate synthase component II [Hymenobacter translucens]
MRLLLLDNFDSFTYNLLDYLTQLGQTVEVVRNDVPLARLARFRFDAIVLSPGPGTPAGAGSLMELIDRYHQQVPMLGVCLGHQALGAYFGAKVSRGARPVHGKIAQIEYQPGEQLFAGIPAPMQVTRYHSLVVNALPPELLGLAWTTDAHRELMALRHRTLPLYGVQFHPEALLTTHGLALLRNWVNCCIIAMKGHPAAAGQLLPPTDGFAD